MPNEKKPFDDKIEELANFLVDRALADAPVEGELIDTFKALSGYYASSRKVGKTATPEDGGSGGGFMAIKKRIAEAGQGAINGEEKPVEH